jgi:hypothetical protein
MTILPYKDKPREEWLSITNKLIEQYPLSTDEILEISLLSWDKLWTTKVGNTINLNEVELPATVIGYFFQKLFTHELSNRYPTKWRGERNKEDKDIVYIENDFFSTEMKSSGQMGYKIFGNRSYNKESQNTDNSLKNKSSYYITINFSGKILTLIRLGWIDQDDWISQASENGQAATLSQDTYKYKLIKINGAYQLKSPVQLLYGIGDKTFEKLKSENIFTFNDIINYSGSNKVINSIKKKNENYLSFLAQYT